MSIRCWEWLFIDNFSKTTEVLGCLIILQNFWVCSSYMFNYWRLKFTNREKFEYFSNLFVCFFLNFLRKSLMLIPVMAANQWVAFKLSLVQEYSQCSQNWKLCHYKTKGFHYYSKTTNWISLKHIFSQLTLIAPPEIWQDWDSFN